MSIQIILKYKQELKEEPFRRNCVLHYMLASRWR